MHWAVKAKEARKWKSAVLAAVMAAGKPPIRLPVEKARLRLTRFSSVSPDFDGCVSGFKACINGLVKAGVLMNDRMSNIGQPEYAHAFASPGKGYIRIEVFIDPPEQGELPNV